MDLFLRDLNSSIAEAEASLGIRYSDLQRALITEASILSLGIYSAMFFLRKEVVFTEENTKIVVNYILKNIADSTQLAVFFMLKMILEDKTSKKFSGLDREVANESCQRYSLSEHPLSTDDFLFVIQAPVTIFLHKSQIYLTKKGLTYIEEVLGKSSILIEFRDYMLFDGLKNKFGIAVWDKFIAKKPISFIVLGDNFKNEKEFYDSIDLDKAVDRDSFAGKMYMTRLDHLEETSKDPALIFFIIFSVIIIITLAYWW